MSDDSGEYDPDREPDWLDRAFDKFANEIFPELFGMFFIAGILITFILLCMEH